MNSRRPTAGLIWLGLVGAGCTQAPIHPEYAGLQQNVHLAAHRPAESIGPDDPAAAALDPIPAPAELTGSRPVDVYIRRALAENRRVQAARYNVLAMRSRIPQVTALDDPMVSNTIYPIPSVAPQYSLMGYNPYNLMIAQQFPWCGTLRLRGEAAEKDVEVALAELAAAQLDAVAEVKRAYFDLYYSEQAERILAENRKVAAEFVLVTQDRYTHESTSQQDVLRARVNVDDIDQQLVRARQGLTEARAALAQQLHVSPESNLRTLPQVTITTVPVEVDRLYRLAVAARPELKGRLAAVAREERSVELAKKRYYPNVTLGLAYMDMEKTNALTPRTAGGFPNVGLFVGFNLPVYRTKLAAGVCEAEARALADAKLYDAERDSTYRVVKELITQTHAQRDIIELFRESILPKSLHALEIARADYEAAKVDYLTLFTAWREVLQIELQVAQAEAVLGKALASLERAVGIQINEGPAAASATSAPTAPPIPASAPGPFGRPGE
jgi:outer membrane protein TolC